jgi:hypothetical protein
MPIVPSQIASQMDVYRQEQLRASGKCFPSALSLSMAAQFQNVLEVKLIAFPTQPVFALAQRRKLYE